MKKYYAEIFHAKSNTHITIGEYSKKSLQRSIVACLKQRGFDGNDCIVNVREEEI